MTEMVWTLFIIGATNGLQKDTIALYARDHNHARERATKWIKQHQTTLPIISIEAYPDGYTFSEVLHSHMGIITLPGQFIESIAEKLQLSPDI
jgi:hypothetical protein